MRKTLRTLTILLISVLTLAGLTAPAHASSPKIKSGTNLSFTDSRGVKSRYHVYSDGVDWKRDVGVLYYFDGDYFSETPKYSQIMQPRGTTLTSIAKNANSKNMVLIAVKTPSGKTKANGWTWWENGASNARWFNEFATAMQRKGKLNKNHTWLSGYSGGAEFITFDLMTQNRSAWMTGGGAIMIAGGGSGSKTKPSTAHRNIPMTWYAGSKDGPGQTNPPKWSALGAAQKGSKTYRNAGYKNAKLDVLPGVGHHGYNLASLINKTTKSVPKPKTPATKVQKINKQYQTNRATVQLKTQRNSKAKAAVTLKSKGTKVTMVERHGSWAKVKYKSKTYWSPWAHYTVAKAKATTKTQKINKAYQSTRKTTIKNGRGTKAKVLATVPKSGTRVTMIERHGSWAKVKYGKTTGWTPWSNYKVAPTVTVQKINKQYKTNRSGVQLKTQRNSKAKAAVTLKSKGTKVTMVERHGSWAKVKYKNKTYWSPWAHYAR